ncbi:hypothetical protein BN2476_850001 [Paraburkholderia piptadeniae]|uniref:Uncharacterized protein n=1 Tax=Paraburkholderia piptadeniae TaxID=1701573 RepID=A0A1N7ST78_9BURK|nr:hypothetical protein BN2476_850001 [Paraburkholderia piptadeniae]
MPRAFAMRWFALLFAGIRDAPRGAGVAPVRGGTYFSLQRQRKVGKRKPLTPPVLDGYPRALDVPVLRAARCGPMLAANALAKRLTRFMHTWHG